MKKQFVRELVVDVEVDSVFHVISFQVRDTRAGQRFLAISLADRTGKISAKRWDVVDAEIESCREMQYARVQGVVEDYRGARQVRLDQPLEPAIDIDPADFHPSAALAVDELRSRLGQLIADIRDTRLKALLHAFFRDPKFRARFDEAPAAKGIHHACRHGLLQHTVEVAETVRAIVDVQRNWGYPPVSRDLAISGALLHDIGKIRELDWSDPAYAYTPTGALIGHIAIGYQMALAKIQHIPGFPSPLRDALLHLILSHHGKLEHGSPVTPMLREAQILTMADDLSMRLFCMTEAAQQADERDFGWHRALEGGRVYAGSLGIADEPVDTPAAEVEVEPSAECDPSPKFIDSPAAAILRSAGNGRYRR